MTYDIERSAITDVEKWKHAIENCPHDRICRMPTIGLGKFNAGKNHASDIVSFAVINKPRDACARKDLRRPNGQNFPSRCVQFPGTFADRGELRSSYRAT